MIIISGQRTFARPKAAAGVACMLLCLAAGFTRPARSERVLMYDEEKGIIFVDKDEAGKPKLPRAEPAVKPAERHDFASHPKNVDDGLIKGKKKDPSGVYFESGLQYFKAGNYDDALRQFIHADSTDPQPVYSLWIGKTYRQLGKGDQVLFIMKRILSTYPDSSVAADALFEIGFYYQTSGDFAKAALTYSQLTEQFPFSKSYSNGEEFREVAKRLKQMMRSEMISTLKILGYKGDEADDLVRGFQKAKDLEVTGQPDQKTVRAMKNDYREYQVREEKKTVAQFRASRYMKWSALIACLCLLCATAMVFARISARGAKKQVIALSQSSSDIDIRNL